MDSSTSPRLSTLPTAGAAEAKVVPVGSLKYYSLCGFGGALAGGLTHAFQPPTIIEQIERAAKQPQANSRFRKTVGSEGVRTLAKSWQPAVVRSAALQGVARLALYDGFKNLYASWLSEESAYKNRAHIAAFSAISAQYLANQLLVDFNSLVLRSSNGAPLTSARDFMRHNKGLVKMSRILDYILRIKNTLMQFLFYEAMLEGFYGHKSKRDCSKVEQLVKTFAAGYIAGIVSSGIFYVPDMLVCKNILSDKHLFLSEVLKQIKFRESLRYIHSMTVVSGLQWLIYEGFKVATSISRQVPPTMPESLRKKMEEVKEQKPSIDLLIDLPYSD